MPLAAPKSQCHTRTRHQLCKLAQAMKRMCGCDMSHGLHPSDARAFVKSMQGAQTEFESGPVAPADDAAADAAALAAFGEPPAHVHTDCE